jgi:hypothetical protein
VSPLPAAATEASITRYTLARELVQDCPPGLGPKIALTGSVARGQADEDSDIEINFWVASVPSSDDREAWLRSTGAADIEIWKDPLQDGSTWATCTFAGAAIELGWQSREALEAFLTPVLAGESTDPARMALAAGVAQAVALRTEGFLDGWQHLLASYPDALQERLIHSAVFPWQYPFEHRVLARRGERIALVERQVRELHRVLRILFALNRQWEPDWKWASAMASTLAVKPKRLREWIDAVFSAVPREGVRALLDLILDTLATCWPRHPTWRRPGPALRGRFAPPLTPMSFRNRFEEPVARLIRAPAKAHRVPESRILEAERRLHLRLPEALRDYYLRVGRFDDLNRACDRLLAPEELRVASDRLLFYQGHQSGAWGIPLQDVCREDPPVYQCPDPKKSEWYLDHQHLSDFWISMLYWQAVNGAMKYVDVQRVDEEVLERIRQHWPRIPMNWEHGDDMQVYREDGQVLWVAKVEGEWEVWAGGRTLKAFLGIGTALGLDLAAL